MAYQQKADSGELEALIGHLFVVGGRAMRGTPPGSLFEFPPKKAQRGREQDTFFTLVTPSGSIQGQAAFYEQLAKLSAELYFRTSGSVTSGLREAITGVNSHLQTHNATSGQRYQANMLCMVLRGHEVFVARTGAMLSLLRQGDLFSTSPEDPRDEFALNGLPLGYSPAPDIKLTHYEIAPGHVIVLSDAGLAAAERDALRAALKQSGSIAIQEALKPLAAPHTQAMIIEFVIPDPSAPVKAVEIPSAARPVRPPGVVEIPVNPNREPATAAPVASAAEPSADPGSVANADLVVMPAISPAPILPAAPAPKSAPSVGPVRRVIRGFKNLIAWLLRSVARFINGILDRLLPEPDDGSPHIPTTVAMGAAILIPIIVVFIVVGFRLSQVDETNFEQLVHQIQDQASQAAAVPASDPATAKTMWLAVLQRVEYAVQQRPERPDPTLQKIRAQAQSVLDGFSKVTRRQTTPLRTFQANAELGAVWVQSGSDIYTLDQNQSAIYRDTLRQPDQIGQRGTQPIVQSGSAVSSSTIKDIVDMIWMDEGGIRTSHALVGLDSQGFLVTYSPTFAPATAQPLQGAERWKKPVAMRAWGEKLYILDPEANQIWRYVPSGTTYPNPPQEYFEFGYQRNLADAIDFAIDEKGSVFVLFTDGSVKKYTAGAEQSFVLNNMPEGGLKAANAMYLDSSSPLPALYITDPVDQSVYEFTLAGTFQSRFRSTDPNVFKKLTSVFAEGNNIYVTDGNVLFYFNTAGPAS